MSVNGSSGTGKIVQAVFAVSQDIVAGVCNQAVKAGFMGDYPVQPVMKLGIVSEYFIQLLSVERVFSLLDKLLQLFD